MQIEKWHSLCQIEYLDGGPVARSIALGSLLELYFLYCENAQPVNFLHAINIVKSIHICS